jgi:outer membrane protein
MRHKNLIKTILLILILFNSKVFAENKTVYLDLNYILNESIAGKSLNDDLAKLQSEKFLIFKKKEEYLQNEQESISKQKSIIKKDEYTKKINKLKKDIEIYKRNRRIFSDEMNQKSIKTKKLFLESLNGVMSEYSIENDISLIVQKKNILLGKSNLDITKAILKKFNKKVKKIDLK